MMYILNEQEYKQFKDIEIAFYNLQNRLLALPSDKYKELMEEINSNPHKVQGSDDGK